MSTSRLEKFIYAICSMEVSDLPAPLSRIEILWNCLITGETPDFEPQSRNEQYLMAMLGLYELENLPTPMSRGEKLLYKIAMGETDLSDIPAYLSRYEELLGYLAENGGVGDFEYILQTLNQRLSALYSTKERPMKQAVIKGDTLVNELPRPSLKNTMANVAAQKLNQGYDNGKTLVNLLRNDEIAFQKAPTDNWSSGLEDPNANRCSARMENIKPNTRYIVKSLSSETKQIYIRFWDGTSNVRNGNTGWININSIITTLSDTNKISISFRLSENNEVYTDISQCSNILLLEYQDGMENWDIPYFEGTKTFSATPNVVDGEFKQAVVKGNTILWDNVYNEEVSNSDLPLGIWVEGHATIDENTGEVISSTVDTITHFLEIPSNLVSINGTATWKKIFYYDAEKKFISFQRTDGSTSSLIVNIPDNAVYMRLHYYKPVDNLTYYPADSDGNEIKLARSISMKSTQLSEVTTTGKNLFYYQNKEGDYYYNKNTGIRTSNTRVDTYCVAVKPSCEYVLSCETHKSISHITFWDSNFNFISGFGGDDQYLAYFETPSSCKYVKFPVHKNILVTNVQLEESDNKTPYEPYQSNTLTLAEPVNLRKIGDVEDEFDALSGEVTERVGEVVLDGSEDWYLGTTKELTQVFALEVRDMAFIDNKLNCDKLPVNASGDVEKVTSWYKSNNERYTYCLYIALLKTKVSTVDGLKTYLSQNPITVQYQLSTESTKTVNPTITDQDGATQTKLHSFNDGHLSVSSQGLFPSVNYEVPTNNSYYLPDMLTLGAQYTSRGSADCNATIDGKLLALGKNRIFTTPSTLTNRLMVLDAPVDDLMFIKGDQTAKDFGYFEGMKSVGLANKMPVLTTSNEDGTKTNILTVNEGVELRGVGDVKDELDLLTGQVTERIGEIVLNGNSSQNINKYADVDGFSTCGFYIDLLPNFKGTSNFLCDKLKITTIEKIQPNFSEVADEEGIAIHINHIKLRIDGSKATTVEELRVYLSSNPITLTVPLIENTVKTVDLTTVDQDDQPTKLKTFNDISYVEVNADNIIPSVDVEIATKISETLSTLGLEHHDISETQNELGQTIDEQTENTDAAMLATTEIYENL